MKKFIRMDMKGHWRGKGHCSSTQGQAGICVCHHDPCYCGAESSWEAGISCYRLELNDKADAFRELFEYWTGIASLHDVEDYEGMQLTVFEGELIGRGADGEDTALCERTIAELDAEPIASKLLDLFYDEKYCGEDPDIIQLEKAVDEIKLF